MRRLTALLAAGLVVLSFSALAPVDAQPATPPQQARGPIVIGSDADLTAPGSGVRSGSGTADDPYIISGWLIDLTSGQARIGIQIANTKAHVVIEDCTVVKKAKDKDSKGVHIRAAKNVKVRTCVVEDRPAEPTPGGTTPTTPAPTETPTQTPTDASGTPAPTATSTETAPGSPDDGPAIHIEDAENVTIEDANVSGAPVQVSNTTNVTLANTTVGPGENGDPGGGVHVDASKNVTLTNNTIEGTAGNGIQVTNTTNVTVADNTVTDHGGSGISVDFSEHMVIDENHVAGNGSEGVGVVDSHNVTITDNEVVGNDGNGIGTSGTTHVTIGNNTVSLNTGNGIEVDGGANVTIEENTVSGNGSNGIVVEDGENATIRDNTVTHNGSAGGGGAGIVVSGNGIQVIDNHIEGNPEGGIVVGGGSEGVDVIGNRVRGPGPGGTIFIPATPVVRVSQNDAESVQTVGETPGPAERADDGSKGAARWAAVLLLLLVAGLVLGALAMRRRRA